MCDLQGIKKKRRGEKTSVSRRAAAGEALRVLVPDARRTAALRLYRSDGKYNLALTTMKCRIPRATLLIFKGDFENTKPTSHSFPPPPPTPPGCASLGKHEVIIG